MAQNSIFAILASHWEESGKCSVVSLKYSSHNQAADFFSQYLLPSNCSFVPVSTGMNLTKGGLQRLPKKGCCRGWTHCPEAHHLPKVWAFILRSKEPTSEKHVCGSIPYEPHTGGQWSEMVKKWPVTKEDAQKNPFVLALGPARALWSNNSFNEKDASAVPRHTTPLVLVDWDAWGPTPQKREGTSANSSWGGHTVLLLLLSPLNSLIGV